MADWIALTGETQQRLQALVRRAPQSIAVLASELGLTDNAVRTHISALMADGLVEQAGVERDTGGKPARLYRLTHAGEELFPKAYGAVLVELMEEVARRNGPEVLREMLQSIGERVASGMPARGDEHARLAAAVEAFRQLGGDLEVKKVEGGWLLRNAGCPLSAVSSQRDEICTLAQAFIAKVTGRPVEECCERGERPGCAFKVPA